MWRNRSRDYKKTLSLGLVWLLVLAVVVLEVFIYACNSPSTQNTSSQKLETTTSSLSQTSSAITRPHVGFVSRQKLVNHFKKHGQEFGPISMKEYLRQAQELRDRPIGKNVLEAVRSNGVISRFDRISGAFIAYNSDGVIRTFFKPNEGEAYFWRQSRRNK